MDNIFSLDLGQGDSIALAYFPCDATGPASLEIAIVADARYGVSVALTPYQAFVLFSNLSAFVSDMGFHSSNLLTNTP